MSLSVSEIATRAGRNELRKMMSNRAETVAAWGRDGVFPPDPRDVTAARKFLEEGAEYICASMGRPEDSDWLVSNLIRKNASVYTGSEMIWAENVDVTRVRLLLEESLID